MNNNNIFISNDAIIEDGVIIKQNVSIKGKSIIKKGTIIDSNTIICDSVIGKDNYIVSSVIDSNNVIGNNNKIGPFSHLRENNKVEDNNIIGNYVEIKNSCIGSNNNIKHLSYIGDAYLCNNINIGAGVICANYHPKKEEKNKILIEDNVSIGSNTTLIAPLKIEYNSMIGAGSILDRNIEKNSLYINRGMEVYKKNYYGEKEI